MQIGILLLGFLDGRANRFSIVQVSNRTVVDNVKGISSGVQVDRAPAAPNLGVTKKILRSPVAFRLFLWYR